jgi:hypothetical protein
MSELTQDAASSELTPFRAYKVRVLPWGETCMESEARLSGLGKRAAWDQRARAICKERRLEWHESMYQAHLEYSPEALESGGDAAVLSASDLEYVARCREGLQMRLPERAGVEKELDWVGANAFRPLPEIRTAPSYFVLNFMIAAKMDPAVLKQFWANSWSKRMSPGDSKSKKQSSVKEDGDGDAESENQEEQLRARLFGGE